MAFLLLCVGILEVLFGYRIYKFMLGVCGFFIGLIFGTAISNYIKHLSGAGEANFLIIIAVAVIGASIAVKVWKLGIFIQCFFYGYAIFSSLDTAFNSGSISIWDIMSILNFNSPSLIGIIGGIIFGILGVMLTRIIIIITSSLTGGFICSLALTGMEIIGYGGIGWAAIIIAAIGIDVQLKYTGREDRVEKTSSQVPVNYRTTIGPEPVAEDNSGIGYCHKCGNKIKPDEQFCYMCGAKRE